MLVMVMLVMSKVMLVMVNGHLGQGQRSWIKVEGHVGQGLSFLWRVRYSSIMHFHAYSICIQSHEVLCAFRSTKPAGGLTLTSSCIFFKY